MKRERKKERDVSASTPSSVCRLMMALTPKRLFLSFTLSSCLSLFSAFFLALTIGSIKYSENDSLGSCWAMLIFQLSLSTSTRVFFVPKRRDKENSCAGAEGELKENNQTRVCFPWSNSNKLKIERQSVYRPRNAECCGLGSQSESAYQQTS